MQAPVKPMSTPVWPAHYPLLGYDAAEQIIAFETTQTSATQSITPITVGQFLVDVQQILALLPAGTHVLNVCRNRYHFMVGFAATLLSHKISLQPPSQTPEMLKQILHSYPDVCCLHDYLNDDAPELGELPQVRYPKVRLATFNSNPIATFTMPQIAANQIAAYVFTSGSTGAPIAHGKTWGRLVENARAAANLRTATKQGYAIVGTVPPQHMYGFESTILSAMHGHCAIWHGRPFYAADIADVLAQLPEPRMLVTTPFHLKMLLEAKVALPTIAHLLCSTAPLSEKLAQQAEAESTAPLYEIYGSTETGQIALRRPTQSPRWQLLPNIKLVQEGEQFVAFGGHLEGRITLSDVLELHDEDTFSLVGRHTDLINIAGKRTSLAALNHQLHAVEGVVDGCFFMPDEPSADPTITQPAITRLAAVVVAPTLNPTQLLARLRQRIDPVFLPRPLLFVAQLPRETTGKLLRSKLQALFTQHQATTTQATDPSCVIWQIPIDHPAFAGHFPAQPILPGVALLDYALLTITKQFQCALQGARLSAVKFFSPVLPGEQVVITITPANNLQDINSPADKHTVKFALHVVEPKQREVASGSITFPLSV